MRPFVPHAISNFGSLIPYVVSKTRGLGKDIEDCPDIEFGDIAVLLFVIEFLEVQVSQLVLSRHRNWLVLPLEQRLLRR